MGQIGLKVHGVKTLFAENFDQVFRIALGNTTGAGDGLHPNLSLAIVSPNQDYIPFLDRVGRFGRPSIKQDKARVAKLLS